MRTVEVVGPEQGGEAARVRLVPAYSAEEGVERRVARSGAVTLVVPCPHGDAAASPQDLFDAYCRGLDAAAQEKDPFFDVVPFGTGPGGFALHTAAHTAARAVRSRVPRLPEGARVRFVCASQEEAAVFRDAVAANAIVRRPSSEGTVRGSS